MPKTIRSEALILRRFRHGETSLVVHAFTRERGRVAFIAKGARSSGKKSHVPLVPVVLLEFIWSPSTRSELQLLREVSLVNAYGGIHDNLERLAWAQAAIESLGRALTGEDSHEILFEKTLDYLEAIATTDNKYENLFQRFRLTLLKELGFELVFDIEKTSTGVAFFNPEKGSISVKKSGRYNVPVHFGTWKILSVLGNSNREEVCRLRISKNAKKEIEQVLNAAYVHVLEKWRPLESLKLLNY